MLSRHFGLAVALLGCALTTPPLTAQDTPRLSLAAETALQQARLLLQKDDIHNAVLLLDTQLDAGRQNPEYVQTVLEAYGKQLRRYQDGGKVNQAAEVWDKMKPLQ